MLYSLEPVRNDSSHSAVCLILTAVPLDHAQYVFSTVNTVMTSYSAIDIVASATALLVSKVLRPPFPLC